MIKLWILFAVSLLLAALIDFRDRKLFQQGSNRKEKLFTWLLIILLALFCGLRTKGNDTGTYLELYLFRTPTLSEFLAQDIPEFASGIALYFVGSLLKTLGFSAQSFLLFFAFATIIPYVTFVRRYSSSMVFGVFLMFTTGFYLFSLAALKQCMATGICLVAVSFASEKRWGKFFLLVCLASLFHPYSIIYFLVPLMAFKPWTPKTFLYMGLFIAVGFHLESLLGTVLDITEMMGASYTDQSFTGEGVNIFRVAVSFVPIILATLYGKKLFHRSTRTEDLMFNLAMVNALIMFVGLFGTANYFARLANYFLPTQVIVLPWILLKAHPKDKAWLIPACVIGYLGYFYYENGILHPFDTTYLHTSFWDYIVSLF